MIVRISLCAGCVALVAAAAGGEDPAVALRERFLSPEGLPAASAYELAEGTAPIPGSESYQWQIRFRAAYPSDEVARLQKAEPVWTDAYFLRTRTFVAPHRALPVWDGRVYQENGRLVVAAYTDNGEQVAGCIDDRGIVMISKDAGDAASHMLAEARYNPFTGELWRRAPGGRITEEIHVFLPVDLVNARGEPLQPQFQIVQQERRLVLVAGSGETEVVLATCTLPDGGTISASDAYSPVLGPGCTMASAESTVVLELPGEIATASLALQGSTLALTADLPHAPLDRPAIEIDGRFDDWRSIPGASDPQGDVVSYLQYNPDTDLLDFKVASDQEHLYFYTRVAGRHGNTAGENDRYYFYIYIDADRNAQTGYVPTRDDNCYFGVALGDDCEAQYEFIGGRFVKTFYGFAGMSTEKDVLSGRVAIGPSWYSRTDPKGTPRDGYKVEYIRQSGQIKITKDYAEGTSDDIAIAISPDGRECEMRASLAGFLRDKSGRPIIAPGQSIDLAAGVEAAGRVHGNQKWGADSTAVVRGYVVAPQRD